MQAGLNLINWLKPYWGELYDLREATRWLELLLNKPGVQAFPAERARALSTQSRFFIAFWSRTMPPRRASQTGLALARLCGDRRIEIDNLLALTYLAEAGGAKGIWPACPQPGT